jgi:hypothetical protein
LMPVITVRWLSHEENQFASGWKSAVVIGS